MAPGQIVVKISTFNISPSNYKCLFATGLSKHDMDTNWSSLEREEGEGLPPFTFHLQQSNENK